ncbi:MAG: dTDP-4-dehydrorhamnose 3,5-epimerase [Chloroflexi bacterium]|nr:dTDP-4-dehydrorhamnose 3,5-epimerase [Chloroflexota bacterium]
MPFDFEPLEIGDVILIKPQGAIDQRGFFREIYKLSDFRAHGIGVPFVQENHSRSAQGVLRGLHYQKNPQAQGKLLSVSRGRVFDVAVDIRRGSPDYGRWVGMELSDENGHMLYVPPGFAHGFCVLSEQADLIYKVTTEYAPDLERGILWNDPAIGVRWPIEDPRLSSRDVKLPLLKYADNNFEFS